MRPHAKTAALVCAASLLIADSTVELANGSPAALSGAATVRVTTAISPGLVCFAQGSTMQLYQPIAATFSAVGDRTYGTATPVPVGKRVLARVFGGKPPF